MDPVRYDAHKIVVIEVSAPVFAGRSHFYAASTVSAGTRAGS